MSSFPAEFDADGEMDTCGLLCPEPVMLLHKRINDMAPGETLRVIATDPSTQRDFTRFCRFACLAPDSWVQLRKERFSFCCSSGAQMRFWPDPNKN